MSLLATSPSSSASLSFLVALLLAIALTTSVDAIGRCSKQDGGVLMQIKRSLGNPPSLATWNASVDCYGWSGVGHDPASGRVNFLRIAFDSNIFGPIPPAIAKLTQLSTLQIFANPNLSGSIPTALCSLRKLTKLDLSSNDLTGAIPSCFRKGLFSVKLGQNRLSGPIPNNFMLGATSVEMSTPWLNLADNQLTGPIPRSLGDVPFDGIELSGNQLTGDASFLFGQTISSSLEYLVLSQNSLQFDLYKLNLPAKLQILQLNDNKIYGSIPPQITKRTKLRLFNVSDNSLCGPIPVTEVLQKFDATSFANNKCLCGGPLQPCR